VRFECLRTVRFGALRDREFEIAAPILLVQGPNEAGKSCFHAAIETILYGFDPGSRDTHPYAVWEAGAADLHLEAQLITDAGERLSVERVLQSSGTVRVDRNGEGFHGPRSASGNRPLPELESVPRALFRAVYSMTANDTHFYKDEVREHVQELLLGETGLEGVRPLHLVRAELADELRQLWKPDNTGNHRAKRLRAELKEARAALREARRTEREVEELAQDRIDLELRLTQLGERRRLLLRESEEAEFLVQIAELRRRADAVHPLRTDTLQGERMQDPVALRAEMHEFEERLAEPRARLMREAPELSASERALLENAPAVAAARRETADHARDATRAEEAEERASGMEDEARERMGRVTGVHAPDLQPLLALPVDALRTAAAHWQADGSGTFGSRRVLLIIGGLGLTLALAAATGFAPPWTAALGAALLGLPLLALGRVNHPALGAGRPPEVDRILDRLGMDADFIPNREALEDVIDSLESARQSAAAGHTERERAEVARHSLSERERRWRNLADELLEKPSGDGPALLEALEAALECAREREGEVREGAAAHERDEALVAAQGPRLAQLQERSLRVQAALRKSFPEIDDEETAHREWLAAENELHFLRERERELRADARWPALQDDPRLDASEPIWSTAARELRETEIESIDEELDVARRRVGKLQGRLEDSGAAYIARAQERVLEVEAALTTTRRERDRLALLENILVEAERRHREANQPDVLRRASEYLSVISGGRYGRLDYPHGEEGDLHVESAERGESVPVGAPLSRGTREQVYLCLRLGTLDYLDRGRESLPLILDEALVHWDAKRREQLYPVLAKVAKRRQVVLFTCHEELAQEAGAALDLRHVDLGARLGATSEPA